MERALIGSCVSIAAHPHRADRRTQGGTRFFDSTYTYTGYEYILRDSLLTFNQTITREIAEKRFDGDPTDHIVAITVLRSTARHFSCRGFFQRREGLAPVSVSRTLFRALRRVAAGFASELFRLLSYIVYLTLAWRQNNRAVRPKRTTRDGASC